MQNEAIPGKIMMGIFLGDDVSPLLALYQQESTQLPDNFIFVCLQSVGREGDKVLLTGAVAIIKMDSMEEVKFMVDQRPENGVYFVFKNGELVDSSERFFRAQEGDQPEPSVESAQTSPAGVPRVNHFGHTLH